MPLSFSFIWFDLLVGAYYDVRARVLYICPLPFCVIRLSLAGFEPQGLIDWLAIPIYVLRYWACWLWTRAWAFARLIRVFIWRITGKEVSRYWRAYVFGWGRHDSPEPVMCPRCLWAGPVRWLAHGYSGVSVGEDDYDVEPTDECPRCGGEL